MKKNKMKSIYLLFALLGLTLGSQLRGQTTACIGEEYCVTLDDLRGTVQWQSSPDNTAWTNMVGETNDTLCVVPSSASSTVIYYRAEITSEPGCAAVYSDVVEFQISDLTSVTATSSDSRVCDGVTITLDGNVTGGASPLTFAWTSTQGFTASTQSATDTPSITDDYTLTVIDNDGCEVSDMVNVIVDPNLTGVDTFGATGSVQYFVVPECRSSPSDSVFIECWGAAGRSGFGSPPIAPGLGGYASGYFYIGNVDTLFVFVGDQNAFNGGMNGGQGGNVGGRGGGASDVRVGGLGLNNRIVVAGGGGGSGARGLAAQPSGAGGDGGGLNGSAGAPDGSQSTTIVSHAQPGLGGSQSIGGNGGAGMQNCNNNGDAGDGGALGLGGVGGDGVTPGSGSSCPFPTLEGYGGGGGGGGYYGGGGGGGGVGVGEPGAGGGGGSSYIGGVSGGTTTPGVKTGNGQIIIHW